MKVVHVKKDTYTHYIGRGSIFGNPYPIGRNGPTREQVIQQYEEYARANKQLLDAIKTLPEDALLACYCSPLPCHGDIIIKLWKELNT